MHGSWNDVFISIKNLIQKIKNETLGCLKKELIRHAIEAELEKVKNKNANEQGTIFIFNGDVECQMQAHVFRCQRFHKTLFLEASTLLLYQY